MGTLRDVYGADPFSLLTREVLRDRTPSLLAETCAWTVGLSDRPHVFRRHGRVVESGVTLGLRALNGQPLGDDADGRLELSDARPGSFQDALNALRPDGRLYADVFEEQVLVPFVLETCVLSTVRARETQPQLWAELLDELGDDDPDPVELIRAAEWEAPLRIEAEQLVLAALGSAPLVELEAEGLPLSLVRAAEAMTRQAGPVVAVEPAPRDEELAGALFLADAAVRASGLEVPVVPADADRLLDLLLAEGLEPVEVLELLPHLPVQQDTAEEIAISAEARELG